MNSKFQPKDEDLFGEDVEGHMPFLRGRIVEVENDDTEAHMPFRRGEDAPKPDEGDDTEGHGAKIKA